MVHRKNLAQGMRPSTGQPSALKSQHPIRLMLVITKLEIGGAQQVVLNTLRRLPRHQYRLFLVAGRGGLLDEEARALPGVDVHLWDGFKHPISPWHDLVTLVRLHGLMRRQRIQVVHTHSSKAGLLGRLAAYWAGVPRIYHTIHGWPFHEHQPSWLRALYVALERLAARITTRMIAVSVATQHKGVQHGIGRKEDYTVIFPGSDLRAFKPVPPAVRRAVRREFGFSDSAPVVGMVACFKPQKAPVHFVAAAAQVSQTLPSARFLMVGDGNLRNQIEREIARQGLTHRVVLAGWRHDVARLIGALDLLALSSLWEGMPCVFAQAMACGIPVVATRVEGAEEAVVHGQTGFLVEPNRIEEMSQALISLLKNPARRRRMGTAAKKQAQAFSLEAMMKKLNPLYAGEERKD